MELILENIKSYVRTAVLLNIFVFAVLAGMQKYAWAWGHLVGALWMLANLLLTFQLWRLILLQQSKAKIPIYIFVKFPFLYVTAYFILISKAFPVESLLLGTGTMLIIMGGVAIWPKM